MCLRVVPSRLIALLSWFLSTWFSFLPLSLTTWLPFQPSPLPLLSTSSLSLILSSTRSLTCLLLFAPPLLYFCSPPPSSTHNSPSSLEPPPPPTVGFLLSKNDAAGQRYYSLFYSSLGQLTFAYRRQSDGAKSHVGFALQLPAGETRTLLLTVDTMLPAAATANITVVDALGTSVYEGSESVDAPLADCVVGVPGCFLTVGARRADAGSSNIWSGTISRAVLYPATLVTADEVRALLIAPLGTTAAPAAATTDLLDADLLVPVGSDDVSGGGSWRGRGGAGARAGGRERRRGREKQEGGRWRERDGETGQERWMQGQGQRKNAGTLSLGLTLLGTHCLVFALPLT